LSNTQSFQTVDAAKWERIKAAVKAKSGITISADTGQASAKGITISWAYDAATIELTITLIKESWYDPSATEIDTDIATWVQAA
jgi:hypothetical protein